MKIFRQHSVVYVTPFLTGRRHILVGINYTFEAAKPIAQEETI
jgi:hypothetical protein